MLEVHHTGTMHVFHSTPGLQYRRFLLSSTLQTLLHRTDHDLDHIDPIFSVVRRTDHYLAHMDPMFSV